MADKIYCGLNFTRLKKKKKKNFELYLLMEYLSFPEQDQKKVTLEVFSFSSCQTSISTNDSEKKKSFNLT